MIPDLEKNSFFVELVQHLHQLIVDTATPPTASGWGEPKRPLNLQEKYLEQVCLAAVEVIQINRQLSHAQVLLAGYRARPETVRRRLNRFEYVVFGIENHLLRTTALLDRCLILTNQVFRLGNNPPYCRERIILGNAFVRGTPTADKLRELSRHVESRRAPRNIVAHRSQHTTPELSHIEGVHILMASEPSALLPG